MKKILATAEKEIKQIIFSTMTMASEKTEELLYKQIEATYKVVEENIKLKKELEKTKWHKVGEQVPTEEKNYLVKLTDGTIDVFYVGIDGNLEPFLVTKECFDFYKDVEKWCEIPKEDV